MLDDLPASQITLYSILIFLFLENLINLYLTRRQIYVYQTSKDVPLELQGVMGKDTFEKARLYGLDKANFEVFKLLVCDIAISSIELYSGFIAMVWARATVLTAKLGMNIDSEIQVSIMFLVLINIIGTFKDMPFKIYSTFVLEDKHGFNKQTPGFFVKDQIKSFLLGQILSVPIVSAIVYIVQIGGDYFFIWLWAFMGVVSLVLITVYPVYIAPLFDKFRPLEEGKLKTSIENLAASLKFPLGKLFVVEGSKRSAHSNAYFTGLFGAKRIVLFDTLLINKGLSDDTDLTDDEKGKGCEDQEVLAVLAHELGHWKLGHIRKNIIIMQVQMFLLFIAFSQLFKYSPLYQAVGFPENVQPILIGFLVIAMYILAPYNTLISFGMTVLSRRFEYQADEFANGLGYSEDLGKALVKLNIDNLGFPVYDWMYSTWNHSHPTLLQRLERLKTLQRKDR
ncbi:CAAX prenyl protease 1 homolog [Malaya genurostris]|uniref:CAAX prenyl protease 1 homolog n=1 Tax=Malaya genurostris TaxID=325434 RepID=UPI0026F3AC99|nr:CAAX prenyl protease 1 homolog [Malaya genurostris]